MSGDTIGMEDWMVLSASLNGMSSDARHDLLARRGIGTDVWDAADQRFMTVLADEVALGDFRRAEEYGRRCAQTVAGRRFSADETATAAPGPAAALPFVPGPRVLASRRVERSARGVRSAAEPLAVGADATCSSSPADDPTLPLLRPVDARPTR